MATGRYESEYYSNTSTELWPKVRQITIDLDLHHLFVPYEGMDGRWYFKVGGTVQQTNELSQRCAELEKMNVPQEKNTAITGLEVLGTTLITALMLTNYFYPEKLHLSIMEDAFVFIEKHLLEFTLLALVLLTILVITVYAYERFTRR